MPASLATKLARDPCVIGRLQGSCCGLDHTLRPTPWGLPPMEPPLPTTPCWPGQQTWGSQHPSFYSSNNSLGIWGWGRIGGVSQLPVLAIGLFSIPGVGGGCWKDGEGHLPAPLPGAGASFGRSLMCFDVFLQLQSLAGTEEGAAGESGRGFRKQNLPLAPQKRG